MIKKVCVNCRYFADNIIGLNQNICLLTRKAIESDESCLEFHAKRTFDD